MEVRLPGISGPQCVVQLASPLPETEIMILIVFEEYDRIYEALAAGATCYLLKTKGHHPLNSCLAAKLGTL